MTSLSLLLSLAQSAGDVLMLLSLAQLAVESGLIK